MSAHLHEISLTHTHTAKGDLFLRPRILFGCSRNSVCLSNPSSLRSTLPTFVVTISCKWSMQFKTAFTLLLQRDCHHRESAKSAPLSIDLSEMKRERESWKRAEDSRRRTEYRASHCVAKDEPFYSFDSAVNVCIKNSALHWKRYKE